MLIYWGSIEGGLGIECRKKFGLYLTMYQEIEETNKNV